MKFLRLLFATALLSISSFLFAAVNLNTATVDELSQLSGIGEKKAQAIVDYRTEHGDFTSVDDLVNVKGIGEKTLANLRDELTVTAAE